MTDFERRLQQRQDELEWLYMELYGDHASLNELEQMMTVAYAARNRAIQFFRNGSMRAHGKG